MNRDEIGQILKVYAESGERAAASVAKLAQACRLLDQQAIPPDRVGLDGHHHRRMHR